MKIIHNFSLSLLSLVILVFVHTGSVSAQGVQENTVLAITSEGAPLRTYNKLQIGIHVLESDVPKFLIGLENEAGGYISIRLKDRQGKNIHRPIFFFRKSLVATFNMSQVEEGIYTMEIANGGDVHKYYIKLENKVMRTVEVKPGVLAKLKH